MKFTSYKDKLIRYNDLGDGHVIVLLHGYLESLDVWSEFADELAKNYRIILIDLPGHGKSDVYSDEHSMDFMADVLKHVLDDAKVEKCFLTGHSMGGYVALAFLESYPHYLSGFSLFHSSPFGDTPEKIINREREIELVKAGKAQIIYNEHVPKTFAPNNITKFDREIEKGIDMAKNTSPEGIIAVLNGMKSRPDRSLYLRTTNLPCLYIYGLQDNFISEDILTRIEFPKTHQILRLENSGHMGFVEEKEETLKGITEFINEFVNK